MNRDAVVRSGCELGCDHEYEDFFTLIEAAGEALIIAVLHEKMDLMVRLRDRLDGR